VRIALVPNSRQTVHPGQSRKKIVALLSARLYHRDRIPRLQVRDLMRSHWLLSLSACVLCVGISEAQQRSNNSSVQEPRAAVPAGLQAPTNKLNERAAVRGFAANGDDRTSLPAAPDSRALGQSDRSDRSYHPMGDTPRSLITPATQRDASLLRVQPGEKVNKFPDTVTGLQFAPQGDSRQTLLPGQVVPSDRHGIGDR
jgi:hypothetical protein